MPSMFAALEDAASATWDATFGEPFEFRPMVAAAGGGRRTVDGSRSVKSVTGVFDDRSFNSEALGAVERTATLITMRHVYLWIARSQFTAGQEPRRLDRFRRTGTGTVYDVSEIQEDGEGRLKIRLSQVSKEA